MPKIKLDSVTLTCAQTGETGKILLCVHGFPFDQSMWKPAIKALEEKSPDPLRIILPDLRGFGKSRIPERAKNYPGEVFMSQFADDLAQLLVVLRVTEPIFLCGLSMGGYICMEFVRRYKHYVAGLILCNTRTMPDSPEVALNRFKTADSVMSDGLGTLVEDMLPKLFCEKSLADKPKLVARTKKMMLKQDPFGVSSALRGMAGRMNSTPLLEESTFPILVLCGEHDVITPPLEMKNIAQQARASFEIIPNAGHLAPLENPKFWANCVVNYLSRQ